MSEDTSAGSERWLSDVVISRSFDTLKRELPPDVRSKFLLIDPEVAHWIVFETDELELERGLEPLDLRDQEVICIPISNSRDVTSLSPTTHWTLLVYSADEDPKDRSLMHLAPGFTHFDSARDPAYDYEPTTNDVHAHAVAIKLELRLKYETSIVRQRPYAIRQAGRTDSALCVILLCEKLCRLYTQKDGAESAAEEGLTDDITHERVGSKKTELRREFGEKE